MNSWAPPQPIKSDNTSLWLALAIALVAILTLAVVYGLAHLVF